MKAGLTPKQQQVYNFLRLFHKVNGYYPTTREIALGIVDGQQILPKRSSFSSVHRFLDVLQERGWIEKMPGRARSLTIL